MPARLRIELTEEQKTKLVAWTKNPPKAYVRSRAWALLLLAQDKPAYEVAADHRVRAHRTSISAWVQRFQAEGVEGLFYHPGQGRKPAFSPSKPGGRAGSA